MILLLLAAFAFQDVDEQVAGAQKASAAADAYKICVITAAQRYASATSEPIDVVADIALGRCANEQTLFRGAIGAWSYKGRPLFTMEAADAQVDRLRQTWRERALAAAADTRITKTSKRK